MASVRRSSLATRLIVMEREGDVEHVRRLNAATGEEVWRKSYTTTYTDRFGHYSNGPYSTPLIEGEHVYTLGAQGQLHCWLLADGDLVWRRLLQDEYQVPEGLFPVAASPFIEGDSLIYNLGATDDEAGVIALNKTTGETLWNATDEPASCATPIAATIHGQRHLIVFGNLNLMSLDPQDGTVLWRRRHYCKSPDSTNATSPIVIDDLVLGVCGPGPGALCMQVLEDGTAEELWTDRRVLDSQFNSLIVIDGFVYGFSTKRQGGALLKCVEIATGELRWELPSDLGRGQGLAANGCLILIGEDGHLASVEVNPNEPILKCITPEPILEKPCYSSPALHKGLLYLRNEKRLVCYDLRGQSQPAGDAPH